MSASRQKKIRQELAAQGVTDPRLIKEAEEKAKEKKANALYITIAVLFVILAAVLLVNKSGVLQRNATALTIDGEKFTAAEMQYYYATTLNNVTSSDYAAYFGLDNSTSLKQQNLNDMAKYFLGVEEDMTWHDYLIEKSKETMTSVYMLNKKAAEENYDCTDEVNETIESTMSAMNSYAAQAGYSSKAYIKLVYGDKVTEKVMKDIMKMQITAQSYANSVVQNASFTDDELKAFVEENPDEFYLADYEYVYFRGVADSTQDAEGNTVQPTDEENAKAAEAAKKNIEEVAKRYKAGEALETIANSIEGGSYYHVVEGTHTGSTVDEWARESGRKSGDTASLNNTSTYYFVKFNSCVLADYNTVDVRHILVRPNTEGLDSESATYAADVEKADAEAKAEAEAILEQWKGNATEEYFAQLADEKSEDGAKGGLYENVAHNQMVTEFNDWIFDASRKAGDTDIVKTTYGYHIMYFVGQNDAYWKVESRADLANTKLSETLEAMTAAATVTEGSALKNIG